jgi:hypothetical protein
VAAYVIGVPLYYRGLVDGCLHVDCGYDLDITPSAAEVEAIGLSVPVYSLLFVLIEVGNAVVFFVVAALLFWRAPGNRVALLGAVCMLAIGASYSTPLRALASVVPFFAVPAALLAAIGNITLYAFFAVFPTGHFVPRLMRYPLVAFAVLAVILELAPSDAPATENLWLLLPSIAGLLGFLLSPALAQLYRYRRVSTPTEREQTKWVVFGVTVALGLLVAFILYGAVNEPEPIAVWGLVNHLGYFGSMVLIPLALLGALFFSRLWSIDVLIRRTLIYTLLTAALALLYLVAVVILQTLVVALTGENRSTLVTVLSTLAIAALFSPLRGWLQRAVDRRFYRRRYSASQTLEHFGATLRDDVELDGLVGRLVDVVDDTMQPEHVSLWLKGSETAREA